MKFQYLVTAMVSLVFAGGALSGLPVAHAGEADVVTASATKSSDGTFRFTISVKHDDTGWDHYANAWDVVGPDGAVLGVRELLHPHVNEQPFTRGLSGVRIPDNVHSVTIRARDLVHDYGGAEVMLELPKTVGQSTSVPN
ncbi:hypothetical protein ACQ0MK_05065 [Thalassospira lucentensis]|uniref:hypothetical protein n=1 Tax=Thalassospira lucentensis TaxID=168935 RepID=UPI003D2F50E3